MSNLILTGCPNSSLGFAGVMELSIFEAKMRLISEFAGEKSAEMIMISYIDPETYAS